MESKLDTAGVSRGDQARHRAYLRDFLPGLLGYCVALIVVVLFGHLDGHSPWRFLWAFLPVVPLFWVVRAGFRQLRRVDEYQRDRMLQGLGTGFVVAMITAVTTGFLGVAGLNMRLAGWAVFVAGMSAWIIASAIGTSRER